jgi:hypothetical protein
MDFMVDRSGFDVGNPFAGSKTGIARSDQTGLVVVLSGSRTASWDAYWACIIPRLGVECLSTR